jgi:hypothetical protein
MILQVETNHNLKPEEVKSRLLAASEELQKEYKELQDVKIDWQDKDFILNFKVMGVKFEGNGKILENKLISNLKIVGVAKLFSKRIKQGMEFKLNQILS